MNDSRHGTPTAALRVARYVPAPPDRVFRAWTEPDQLQAWWGPKGVSCIAAEIDLRVGGQYRIANQLPDRSVLWISGNFEAIERPHLLVYTWSLEAESSTPERVTVRFEPRDRGTEIIIIHEQIATRALSEEHEHGWIGCLDGLLGYLAKLQASSNGP